MKKKIVKKKKPEKKGKVVKREEDVFLESWNFILSCKSLILFSALLFLFSFILGLVFFPPEVILDRLKILIEEMQLLFAGADSFLDFFSIIFLNNLRAGFLFFVLGLFFGIFPFFALLANGYFAGFVSSRAVASTGWSALLSLVPHGIFELPAIFICAGLGFKLGFFFLDKDESFLKTLSSCIKAFIFFVIPLLFIAAIIEAFLILSLN